MTKALLSNTINFKLLEFVINHLVLISNEDNLIKQSKLYDCFFYTVSTLYLEIQSTGNRKYSKKLLEKFYKAKCEFMCQALCLTDTNKVIGEYIQLMPLSI